MANCKVCNSSESDHLLKWKRFDIYLCKSCKLVYTTPLPSIEELGEFYNGFLFNRPEQYEIDRLKKFRRKELTKLFELTGKPEGTFFDYGAGTGVAFQTAKELGFDAYYFDLDDQAKSFTRENFGLKDDRIIEDLDSCNVKFNSIFSDNVIEHVTEPQEFVEDLIKFLEPNGMLVIKTPHARNTEIVFTPKVMFKYFNMASKYNSFGKSMRGMFKFFWHVDPPRHLYGFSKKSLQALMKNIDNPDVDYRVEYYKIPLFENTFTKLFFTRDKKAKWYQSILFRIVLLPFIPIEVFLQLIKLLLVSIGVLSPGGIILKVLRRQNS